MVTDDLGMQRSQGISNHAIALILPSSTPIMTSTFEDFVLYYPHIFTENFWYSLMLCIRYRCSEVFVKLKDYLNELVFVSTIFKKIYCIFLKVYKVQIFSLIYFMGFVYIFRAQFVD